MIALNNSPTPLNCRSNSGRTFKTIPRVMTTPRGLFTVRERSVTIEQPQIGSLVARIDNGYSYRVDEQKTFVVVAINRSRTSGMINKIFLCPVVSVTDTTVTYESYDATAPRLTLKPYFNSHGNSWNDTAVHRTYFYQFDRYVETIEGDPK